jgi:hypothetical protein
MAGQKLSKKIRVLSIIYRIIFTLVPTGLFISYIPVICVIYRSGYYQLFDFQRMYGIKAYVQGLSIQTFFYLLKTGWLIVLGIGFYVYARFKRREKTNEE